MARFQLSCRRVSPEGPVGMVTLAMAMISPFDKGGVLAEKVCPEGACPVPFRSMPAPPKGAAWHNPRHD